MSFVEDNSNNIVLHSISAGNLFYGRLNHLGRIALLRIGVAVTMRMIDGPLLHVRL